MFKEIFEELEALNHELATRNFDSLEREDFIADNIQKILNGTYIPEEEYAF